MKTSERIGLLNEAREALGLAIENIEEAVRGTPEQGRARLYIIGHLKSWISQEDTSIDNLINRFRGSGEGGSWSEEEIQELIEVLPHYFEVSPQKAEALVRRMQQNGTLENFAPGDEELLDEFDLPEKGQ